MKILQSIPYFNPKFGGDVNVCVNLSKYLAMRNHVVTIITTDFNFDSDYANTICQAGVEVIPLPCIGHIGLFLYSPKLKIWLEKNLKGYDIIHLHNFRSYQNIAIYSFAEKYDIPYILQAHGSVLPFFEKQNLKKMYDFIWGKRLLHYASRVIALTENEAEQYQKMGMVNNKIEIIPNGIDLSQFSDLPQEREFKVKYHIPEKEKMILFLGRIHKIKGIELLISAFSIIIERFPETQLVIVGPDDNYLQELEKHIDQIHLKKKPIFTGALYGREKLAAYVDAAVFVLPSHFEAFPMTLLEAMICGTPVIITNDIKNFDWIHNKAGFVVRRDPDALAQHISILLNDENMRHSLGETGKEIVKREFDLTKSFLLIENLYTQLKKENLKNI